MIVTPFAYVLFKQRCNENCVDTFKWIYVYAYRHVLTQIDGSELMYDMVALLN